MKIKYPRTFHLPYSLGATKDDKVLPNDSQFKGKEIVATIKMDGENTSLYKDGFHARSTNSLHCDYHSWLANYLNTFSYLLPDNWRICGEYMYAKHSIAYDNLKSFFYGFSIWEDNICLSWDDTLEYFKILGIEPVEEVYRGIYDAKKIRKIAEKIVLQGQEGLVIRNIKEFELYDFSNNVAKYVRNNHVQTSSHWKYSNITPNILAS